MNGGVKVAMSRKEMRTAALCAALLLGACQQEAELPGQEAAEKQPKIVWKIQSLWQNGTLPQKIFEEFAERVRESSGGRLVIEPLAINTIVSSPESLDAVAAGVLDGHHSSPVYYSGKDAAFALLGDLQGGFGDPYQMQIWMEHGGGNELARELYARYGVHFVGAVWSGVESLASKKPIRTLEDFKGLKVRAPQGMTGEILSRLGAAPVQLPGSEVYTALDRGIVDASDWNTLSMNEELGLHKLARYPSYPGFHSMPMLEIAINKRRWDALPADLKAIVEIATRDFATAMIQRSHLADMNMVRKAGELGFEPIDLPAVERQRFREVAQSVWQQYAARSPIAQKVYDSQIEFLMGFGLL